MILGSTLKALMRLAPGYRIVSPAIARTSVSVCTCKSCVNCICGRTYGTPTKDGKPQFVCKRVYDRLPSEESGYAIVAWNGSCDRAQFRKEDQNQFTLSGTKQ